MIKHLIFDFGGVILNLGADAGAGKKTTSIADDIAFIFDIPKDTATFLWNENKDLLITGYESPKQFLQNTNNLLKKNIDIDQAKSVWKKRYALEKKNINWDLVNFIEELKRKYQIHMLTDAIDLDRGADEWIHTIEKHFNNIYRSYEEKLRKPNAEAYINVLNKIHAKPDECIFIDDFEPNIQAAKKLGIQSFLFTSVEKLKEDLKPIARIRISAQ